MTSDEKGVYEWPWILIFNFDLTNSFARSKLLLCGNDRDKGCVLGVQVKFFLRTFLQNWTRYKIFLLSILKHSSWFLKQFFLNIHFCVFCGLDNPPPLRKCMQHELPFWNCIFHDKFWEAPLYILYTIE